LSLLQVDDLTGNCNGSLKIVGTVDRVGRYESLQLDGEQVVRLTSDIEKVPLPTREMTVETWLRVDQMRPWSAMIGVMQDNGLYERGWVLGIQNSRFAFAVATTERPRLSNEESNYLTSQSEYEVGLWYHVAGVYDGQTLKLYVNGKLENSTRMPGGDILYPPHAFYELGAYHDTNEYFPLNGRLHEICLYDRALEESEILQAFRAKSELATLPKPTSNAWQQLAAAYLVSGNENKLQELLRSHPEAEIESSDFRSRQ
jgi:hypothetical protein